MTRVLIKRSGALGDVILASPVARRFAETRAVVEVQTHYPEVFIGNPYVRAAGPALNGTFDRVIDLDMAYERNPKMHVVDAYMMQAFGDTNYAHKQQFLHPNPFPNVMSHAVIHAGVSWPNRTLSCQWWDRVCRRLVAHGLKPVAIGGAKDHLPLGATDLRGRRTLAQTAWLIQRSYCFIGVDSGPLHIAGSTNAPIIGIFTCAKAEYRLAYRGDGEQRIGQGARAITPKIDCYGCLADYEPPVTYGGCRRGDLACVSMISDAEVFEAVMDMRRIPDA